ncbi:MAG: hypothetical protein M1385_00325 [Candidatus Marsarchaeota archaeon]|nr:hypothetical protein [Candidatus Marsarchaeota archaeon]
MVGLAAGRITPRKESTEFIERAHSELDFIRKKGIIGEHNLYKNNSDLEEYSYVNSFVSILENMLGFRDDSTKRVQNIVKYTFNANNFSLKPNSNTINIPSTIAGMMVLNMNEMYLLLDKCIKFKSGLPYNNGFLTSSMDKNISSVFFTALEGIFYVQLKNYKKAQKILEIIEKNAKIGKHGTHMAYADFGPEIGDIGLSVSILKVYLNGYVASEEYIQSSLSICDDSISTHALSGILFAAASECDI